MKHSTHVAIMTAQQGSQVSPFYAVTEGDKTKLHLSKDIVSETDPKKLLEVVISLEEKVNKLIEKDEDFKRKLTLTISEIHQRQELTLDGYDKIKKMADSWFGKDD